MEKVQAGVGKRKGAPNSKKRRNKQREWKLKRCLGFLEQLNICQCNRCQGLTLTFKTLHMQSEKRMQGRGAKLDILFCKHLAESGP